jgi:hypothetical protein
VVGSGYLAQASSVAAGMLPKKGAHQVALNRTGQSPHATGEVKDALLGQFTISMHRQQREARFCLVESYGFRVLGLEFQTMDCVGRVVWTRRGQC